MLVSLYFTLLPLILIAMYIVGKYVIHKNELQAKVAEADYHNFEDVKEGTLVIIENIFYQLKKSFNIFLHWILHVFVIVLGVVSDVSEYLYSNARDFFLKTAAKEKDVVATFWHHLKDYKKEKEEEK